jgi:hypothetical protein
VLNVTLCFVLTEPALSVKPITDLGSKCLVVHEKQNVSANKFVGEANFPNSNTDNRGEFSQSESKTTADISWLWKVLPKNAAY